MCRSLLMVQTAERGRGCHSPQPAPCRALGLSPPAAKHILHPAPGLCSSISTSSLCGTQLALKLKTFLHFQPGTTPPVPDIVLIKGWLRWTGGEHHQPLSLTEHCCTRLGPTGGAGGWAAAGPHVNRSMGNPHCNGRDFGKEGCRETRVCGKWPRG